jgi:hypothetical protein
MGEYSDKIPRVISQARKATTPFKAWYYFFTDDIFDNIVQHIKPVYSHPTQLQPLK